MKLDALSREQCQHVRLWRNEEPQFLRTPYFLTEKIQDEFYDNVVCNRDSKHRYFSIIEGDYFLIGMGGITNIEWENRTAEISLIINPEYRGKGYGRKAVDLLIKQGFGEMGLYSIYGEVYDCGNYQFWRKLVEEKIGYYTNLKHRKMHQGFLYGSTWFCFESPL